MSGIAISRTAARKIQKIFEHPDEVFSIYLKNSEEAVWVQGKIELYNFIRGIGA